MGYEAFISLGSNMGLCSKNLQKAIAAMSTLAGLKILSKSGIYYTEPQDMLEQPWFINQVVCVGLEEQITPTMLLKFLKEIEQKMGRLPGILKGPRVIDLDILIFGNKVVRSQELIIPHPQMKKRAFVLIPLQEISPDFIFPDGESVAEAVKKIQFRVVKNRIYQRIDT